MRERRFLYFVLGVATTVSIGAATSQGGLPGLTLDEAGITFPDGTVQTTAAVATARRSFYLTTFDVSGAAALLNCAGGYHMASLWEMLDVSNLRYDTTLGEISADSGEGPPSFAAIAKKGWVRTGSLSGGSGAGSADCNAWTVSSSGVHGTWAALTVGWDGLGTQPVVDWLGPWVTGTAACDESSVRVWCIEDD